jgi:hypothetical protein
MVVVIPIAVEVVVVARPGDAAKQTSRRIGAFKETASGKPGVTLPLAPATATFSWIE